MAPTTKELVWYWRKHKTYQERNIVEGKPILAPRAKELVWRHWGDNITCQGRHFVTASAWQLYSNGKTTLARVETVQKQ